MSLPGGPWLAAAGSHLLVLTAGSGACALALLEPRRPSLVLAGLGAAAVVAALVTGWRLVGSAAVLLVGATPLMAGALEAGAAATPRLVAATVLPVLMVLGLDGVERRGGRSRERGVLRPAGPGRRLRAPLLALGACAALSVVAAAPVAPSVGLVLVGLAAAVAAVVTATRVH